MIRKCIALAIVALVISGCESEEEKKSADILSQYEPSGVTPQPMVFPAGGGTTYKKASEYKLDVKPQPYKQNKKWTIYIASPGWTTGGMDLAARLGNDTNSMNNIERFLYHNNLSNVVDTAWIQYDVNPGQGFVESIEKVPYNYIPMFLQTTGPRTNYYIYSPSSRYGQEKGLLRYDEWLKPFFDRRITHGDDLTTMRHKRLGIEDFKSKYWDHWARHYFIVNPEGLVVDAYLSNLGKTRTYGSTVVIKSLIHHLDLDASEVWAPDLTEFRMVSLYSAPYWEGLNSDFLEGLDLKSPNQ